MVFTLSWESPCNVSVGEKLVANKTLNLHHNRASSGARFAGDSGPCSSLFCTFTTLGQGGVGEAVERFTTLSADPAQHPKTIKLFVTVVWHMYMITWVIVVVKCDPLCPQPLLFFGSEF